MKLNPDCIRDILLLIEDQPFEQLLQFNDLQTQLNDYTYEELTYTCLKLNEAGLIKAVIANFDNHIHVEFIQDLTFSGHEFLNNIQSDNVWNQTKDVLSKIGTTSVNSITFIANQVIAALIKKIMNI